MPSCLLSDCPGSALHVGKFVHVREVEGRDKGRLKVYRIERLRVSDRHFYGQYWEQPPALWRLLASRARLQSAGAPGDQRAPRDRADFGEVVDSSGPREF
jgi:hypothetical protein